MDGFTASLTCGSSQDEIVLFQGSPSTELFGDDISDCQIELLNFSINGVSNDASDPSFVVAPSKIVPLDTYTAGEDVNVSFSITQVNQATLKLYLLTLLRQTLL